MKLTKGKIIAAVAVIAVLAGAFWYGGNAPGLQGWTVQEQESSAVLEAAPPASGPEESIAPIVTPGGEAESPPPTVSGSPVPSETPQETDALAPSPTPGGLDARPGGAEGGMTAREKVEAAAELAGGSSAGVEKGDKEYSEANGMEINPETGKDKYLTDPVPEGKPLPVEPQDVEFSDVTHTCTLSVRCDTILDNMDWLDPEKVELVPESYSLRRPLRSTRVKVCSMCSNVRCGRPASTWSLRIHQCTTPPILRGLTTSMNLTAESCPAGCIR